jgi:hypothetical protein
MTAFIFMIYMGGTSTAIDRGRGFFRSLVWPWDLGAYLFKLSVPKEIP